MEHLVPIILIGKSGSGKDTTTKILCEKFGLKKVVECTTRKMREGEVEGETYNFMSEAEFQQGIADDIFAAYTIFNRIQDGHTDTVYYGIRRSDITTNVIIPTNPENMNTIKKEYKHAIVVYLYVPDIFRNKRLIERGDEEAEVIRRSNSDAIDFEPENLRNVDITIYNTNTLMSPEMVADEIMARVRNKVGA